MRVQLWRCDDGGRALVPEGDGTADVVAAAGGVEHLATYSGASWDDCRAAATRDLCEGWTPLDIVAEDAAGRPAGTFRAEVVVRCPFCPEGGKFTLGRDDRGYGVLHTVPTCAEYRDLDAVAFATLARSRIEGTS